MVYLVVVLPLNNKYRAITFTFPNTQLLFQRIHNLWGLWMGSQEDGDDFNILIPFAHFREKLLYLWDCLREITEEGEGVRGGRSRCPTFPLIFFHVLEVFATEILLKHLVDYHFFFRSLILLRIADLKSALLLLFITKTGSLIIFNFQWQI